MASKEAVTNRQGAVVCDMANQKGVTRSLFQSALDDGTWGRFLNVVKEGRLADFHYLLTPPPGGRIHVVRVPVDPSLRWKEAVEAAGPDTSDDHHVKKIGRLYTAIGGVIRDETIILVNIGPEGGSWGEIMGWARVNNLKLTHPRQVFAIGKYKPSLHKELGMKQILVMETTGCLTTTDLYSRDGRHACGIMLSDAERSTLLYDFDYHRSVVIDQHWLAFVLNS